MAHKPIPKHDTSEFLQITFAVGPSQWAGLSGTSAGK